MGPPSLEEYASDLGLPPEFHLRKPIRSAAVRGLIREFSGQVGGRKFLIGLLLAFVGVVEDLLSQLRKESCADALAQFPPHETDSKGKRRNSLYLQGPDRAISLRSYYNAVESVIARLRRFDYPRCAPHATQAWPQHREMLVSVFALAPGERRALVDAIWKAVLALKEFKGREGAAQSPRPYSLLLTDFPHTRPGEPAGALLQALAFAYYRADAPNVTLETAKVGAGSKRTGRVGDIDGWSGDNLVLSIEVKDIDIDEDSASAFVAFEANLADWPDATAIVVARSFTDGAAEALGAKSIRTMDRATMARNVALWDLRKQQLAMRETAYFLKRVQRNSKLLDRFVEFAQARSLEL